MNLQNIMYGRSKIELPKEAAYQKVDTTFGSC